MLCEQGCEQAHSSFCDKVMDSSSFKTYGGILLRNIRRAQVDSFSPDSDPIMELRLR